MNGVLSRLPLRTFLEVMPVVAYRGLAGGMPILIGLYIGHRWGLEQLGYFTFAYSLVAVGLVVTDWGCTRWMPRELALASAASEHHSSIYASNAMRLVLGFSYVGLTAVLALTGALSGDAAIYAGELASLYFIAIVSTNAMSDRFVRRELMAVGVAVGGGVVLFLVLAAASIHAGAGAHALILCYVCGKVVEAAILMQGRRSLMRVSLRHVVAVAAKLWPFSVQAILGVVYSRLSVFIIQHLRPVTDVGIIGAALALQNVVLLLPTSMALLLYPAITAAASRRDIAGVRSAVLKYGAVCIPAIAIGLALIAIVRVHICRALHVPPADAPFMVAIVAVAFITVATTMAGILLQAARRESMVARLSVVTIALAIGYQYVLIRMFGLWGAAYAAAAAEITSLLVFAIAMNAVQLNHNASETPGSASSV